jgi:Mn2+/Fe2+ NRAMP family transporter
MKKILGLTLGILVALGGFVDIGDLVFNTQAGAAFGYQLLWVVPIGVLGIMVFTEMCGRVATVTGQPVFSLIRQHYNPKLGWFTLVSSLLLNILTCAAEIGGVALAIQLLTDLPYQLLILIVLLALLLIVWKLPFQGIERLFGIVGLGLIAFLVAAIKLNPDWGGVAHGFVPQVADGNMWNYAYFAVGILAATFMPYEVYFYSSGAIEDKWKPKEDMVTNRANTLVGYLLGGAVISGIIIMSAELLRPKGISPEFLGTPLLGPLVTLGKAGLAIAILGAIFAIGGAAIESCFSSAYNLSQFLGWKWGKHLDYLKVPKFTLTWVIVFVLAAGIIMTGIDPISLTEDAVIFSVLVMPLTYWPIFKKARDKAAMGEFTNKRLANTLGWIYLVIIVIVSLVAVPLQLITNRGQLL